GLPQGAVREGRERVTAALGNSGYSLPPRRITVNLAPADVRKDGSAFDLPIAIGLLAGAGVVPVSPLAGSCFAGELGLDVEFRAVRGRLPLALHWRREGVRPLVVPAPTAGEAWLVDGLDVRGARTLAEVVSHLRGESEIARAEPGPLDLGGRPDETG